MKLKEAVNTVLRRRPRQLTVEEYAAKLMAKGLHPDGTPVLDPVPLAPPVGYKKQPSMVEIVRDMVRGERLRQEAEAAGVETFEEADDFDVGDDPELMRSGWENDFDPPIVELVQAGRQAVADREAVAGKAGDDQVPPSRPTSKAPPKAPRKAPEPDPDE